MSEWVNGRTECMGLNRVNKVDMVNRGAVRSKAADEKYIQGTDFFLSLFR